MNRRDERDEFDQATADRLRRTMVDTYFHQRIAMSVLAFAFPLVCEAYWLEVGPHQLYLDSISAFYGTNGLARDRFVGILWAIASFLVAYRGLTIVEDWILSAAGLCLALVAIIPCACWYGPSVPENTWHMTCAISFFVLMGIVILWFGNKTINLLPDRWRPVFRWAYFVNGLAFIGSIATVLVLYKILPRYTRFVFRLEWLGIWSFSAFWAPSRPRSREPRAESPEPRAQSSLHPGCAIGGARARLRRRYLRRHADVHDRDDPLPVADADGRARGRIRHDAARLDVGAQAHGHGEQQQVLDAHHRRSVVLFDDFRIRVQRHRDGDHRGQGAVLRHDLLDGRLGHGGIGDLLRLPAAEHASVCGARLRSQDIETPRLGQAMVGRERGRRQQRVDLFARHRRVREAFDRAALADGLRNVHASKRIMGTPNGMLEEASTVLVLHIRPEASR